MKQVLLLCLAMVFTIASFSQAPSGNAQLNFGDTAHFEQVSLEFVEVLSDSRCPKNVSCIRAGEAEVLVAVYYNGKFSHEKKLIFDASGIVLEKNVQLFNSEYLNIQGLALYPYPIGINKIKSENYFLDLAIN